MALDEQMTKFLDGIVGAVEANSFEHMILWEKNEHREHGKVSWETGTSGFIETVGFDNKRPVCVSMVIDVIDGHKILFWEATSQVVNHKMIDQWFKDHLPPTAFRFNGYPNKVNAMNFHNVFPRNV